MPLASKIACVITLGVLALNIPSGLALPVTSEIGQTMDVVKRDPDFTSTRATTLVSRTDNSSSDEALKKLHEEVKKAPSSSEAQDLISKYYDRNPYKLRVPKKTQDIVDKKADAERLELNADWLEHYERYTPTGARANKEHSDMMKGLSKERDELVELLRDWNLEEGSPSSSGLSQSFKPGEGSSSSSG